MKSWLKWYKKLVSNKDSNQQNQSSNQSSSSQRDTPKNTEPRHKETIELSADYKEAFYTNKNTGKTFILTLFKTISDEKVIEDFVLPPLLGQDFRTIEDVSSLLPIPDVEITDDLSSRDEKLLNGYVEIKMKDDLSKACYVAVNRNEGRSITQPEIEYSVIGPKESFVESLDININLLRKRLPVKDLVILEKRVGTYSKTRVAVVYIKGLADEENINTIEQRLEDMKYDNIVDSSFVEQIISDQHNSPFPLALDTERPDRTSAVLTEGKVVMLVDGSPHALIAPTTLVEFFNSFDDYLTNWMLASFFRLLRLFSVAFSILITPIYVAALSYHYELIPGDLLGTLVASRQKIPLPPILEAIFLELTIELLREAGARLPTKVGQTIGIVGGIVIGTASVEAGLTSNVLLIIVALAALASFTTPVYKIGNAIRVLRFPFLIFAEIWGLLGIVYCFCILMAYTLNLTSLGRPFLEPLFPPRFTDFRDALIRLPFSNQKQRPMYTRPYKPTRFRKKEKKKSKDIDE